MTDNTIQILDEIYKFIKDHPALTLTIGTGSSFFGVLFGAYIKEITGDRYKIKQEIRQRDRRLDDLFMSAYHEIGIDLTTTSLSFNISLFKSQIDRMVIDPDYFPVWTTPGAELFAFENEIKKETLAIAPEIRRSTYEFYQAHLYTKTFLSDSRSDIVDKLPQVRRADFLLNLYQTAFDSIRQACQAAQAYEAHKIKIKRNLFLLCFKNSAKHAVAMQHFFSIGWAAERFGHNVIERSPTLRADRSNMFDKIAGLGEWEAQFCDRYLAANRGLCRTTRTRTQGTRNRSTPGRMIGKVTADLHRYQGI